jgi:hypothetical protein
MKVRFFPRLSLLGAASILLLAAPAAMGQSNQEQAPPAGDKTPSAAQKLKAPAQQKTPSGYATEAEARSHCKTVVWVDRDHFNHYPGSREYGKKPGNFACEQG